MRSAIGLLLMLPSLSAAAELRVGAAAVPITPPPGAPMAGYYYGRAADGVHDELFARALVLDDGLTRAALVACDLSSMPAAIVESARLQIAQKTNIPAANVMISATHTHTGPSLVGVGSRDRFEGELLRIARKYTEDLPALIAAAVVEAHRNLRPASLSAAIGNEPSLIFNRRYHMIDGSVGWNPGKLNPRIVRPAGPIDAQVPFVTVMDPGGKPVAVYLNYALHLDTVGGTQYSADFPYTVGRLLAAAKGDDVMTLFTIGCAGNLNHIDVSSPHKQSSHQDAARIGAVLAAEVLRAWKSLVPASGGGVRVSSERLQLPSPAVTEEDIRWSTEVAATYGAKQPAPFIDLVKAFKVLDVAALNGRPREAEVQVIAVGDSIAWVALPGEIFTELGMAIKQASPFRFTLVATQGNGSLGYFPNRKAFPEGAYEVVSSRSAPGSGEMMVESATRQLIQLHRHYRAQAKP